MNRRNEDSRIKGDIAEKLFELECLRRDIPYYVPGNANSRVDYVVNVAGEYKRVQIKYISAYNGKINITFQKQQNGRRGEEGGPLYLKYDADEIDMFLVYNPDTESFYEVDLNEHNDQKFLSLRIDPPKNAVPNIKLAENFKW